MNIIEFYFGSLKLTEKFERTIIGGGDNYTEISMPTIHNGSNITSIWTIVDLGDDGGGSREVSYFVWTISNSLE